MRADRTAIFTDLDGTLFGPDGLVSPENRAAIEAYIAEGGRFAVATGREPANALRFLGDLPMNAPSVVLNGAAVYDYAAGEYLYTVFLDKGRVEPALRALLDGLPLPELQAYTRRGICYCTPEAMAQPQLLRLHKPCVFTTLDELADEPFFKCFLYAPPERDAALTEALLALEAAGAARHVPGTTDVGGRITYHELLPMEASKGEALRFLRSHPALRGRTIIAAGDYWNDYELLREADISVAPANSIPEIRAMCDHTAAANHDHTIRDVIRRIIPAL